VKKTWPGLIVVLALGISAGFATVFLASPKFWSADRVEDEAESLIRQSDVKRAIALYQIGARHQRDQRQRDRLYWKACDIFGKQDENESALNTCIETAKGPKRMIQAKALLVVAGLYYEGGHVDKAKEVYRDLTSRYWDYRQGRIAHEELSQLILEELLWSVPASDYHQKIDAFIRENISSDFSTAIARKAVAWSLSAALNERLEFNADLLAKVRAGYSLAGGEELIRQISALANLHADGGRLKTALRANQIPVKDELEDIVNFAMSGSEGPPDKKQVLEYIASLAEPDRLDEALGVSTNAGIELRNTIANIWRGRGRLNDGLRLLESVVDVDAPGIGFAQANFLMAQCEEDLGMENKAAQRYAGIIKRWPHFHDVCVRSARAASRLFLKIGDTEAAKLVLEKGAEAATGADRIDMQRRAMEIE
jgi:Tetratricopeptide repeat